jgi:hypothetical protein
VTTRYKRAHHLSKSKNLQRIKDDYFREETLTEYEAQVSQKALGTTFLKLTGDLLDTKDLRYSNKHLTVI